MNNNIDRSFNPGGDVNISGNQAPVTLNLGEISGRIDSIINQLPASPHLEKPGIKELLEQLKAEIESESSLNKDQKVLILEQVNTIAKAAQNPKEEERKNVAKKAFDTLVLMIQGLNVAVGLPRLIESIKSYF